MSATGTTGGTRSLQPPSAPPRPLAGFEHINRYWDRNQGVYTAKILPGEFYVTRSEEAIATVLGSCVSACIHDTVAGVGGMNHFMLPQNEKQDGQWAGSSELSAATRYGDFAMEKMINEILKNGGRRERLEVKIFGGGRILAQMTDIGERNITFVRQFIRTEGLRVVSEDVGDVYPRKVLYFPRTGRVRINKLRSMHYNTFIEREQQYQQVLETKPVGGEVELF